MAADNRQSAEFISEAEEIIEAVNKDLFALEEMVGSGTYNPEVVNAIFRGAHSLKGLAGMFGFSELQSLAHDVENLLDALRLGKIDLGGEVVDLLFRGVEGLGRLVAAQSKGEALPDVEGLRRQVLAVAENLGKATQESPALAAGVDPKVIEALTEYEEHRLNDNIKRGNNVHKATARFQIDTFDTDLAELTETLKKKGEVLTTLPSGEASGEMEIVFDILVGTTAPIEELRALVSSDSVRLASVVDAGAKKASPPAPPPADLAEDDLASLRSVSQTVRVDISRLDYLMNIVGELVVQRNIFGRLADDLRDKGLPKLAQNLGREVRTLERKLADLQHGVMEVRMVPVSQIFERLARVVRKVARSGEKQIELETRGGDTELDKLLIEDLADPLMHLIRNSIDHGIETPEERGQAGKSPVGRIVLRAYPEGNHVVMEVSDDGRGIDAARIRQKAIEKGLMAPNEEISEEDVLDFIYLAGFSTRDAAGELSGRGVGMDVVKSNIANMSGVIETRSKVGEGTTIKLTLPITLAIIGALVIETRGRTYVIPVNSVQQCLRVTEEELMSIENRKVMQVEGRTVPIVDLGEFLRLDGADGSQLPYRYVIVVGLAEKRIGILVDRIQGQQDIVIKPVGELLAETPGIAGATELSGQTTVLVLDVGEIIEGSSGGGIGSGPKQAVARGS